MIKATERPTTIPVPQASRRALLMGFAAAATPMAPALANALSEAPAGDVDPVFAAIKLERDAFAAYCATSEITSRIGDEKPPRGRHKAHAAWWARQRVADNAHTKSAQDLWAAREAFLKTQPTSVAGLLAFLDHMGGALSEGEAGEAFFDENEKEIALPTLAAAARHLIAGRLA
jgi:hypothetical protein